MTKEEILAMEAGLQLDILVAEEILGYKIYAGATASTAENVLVTSRVPRYSTGISSAWQVVEKMIENGWSYHGFSSLTFPFSGCEFIKELCVSAAPCNLTEAKSMPEAICKAALLALQNT